MINREEQIANTEELLENIAHLMKVYLVKMGVDMVPNFMLKPLKPSHKEGSLTIKELIYAINSSMDNNKLYPNGILTKRRDTYVVTRRQILCYIARQMGYTHEEIGREIKRSHATTIHSENMVINMLKLKDENMIRTYQLMKIVINQYYKDKYGKDLPEITARGNNS